MKLSEIKEGLRQSENRLRNINYVMSNMIIRYYLLQLEKDDKCKTFRDLLENKSDELIKFFREHDLYKHLIKEGEKEYSDFLIKWNFETFLYDIYTYNYSVLFSKCKGDLHCITGNDGDLCYIFICSECGTIIIDDHSADYQYNCPTLLCPVCNELREDSRYPFEYIIEKDEKYYDMLYHYSMYVKKQLLSNKDRDERINYYCSFELNRFKRFFKKFQMKRHFKKNITDKFVPMDYISGTDMSNVELKYLNKEK